MELAAVLEDVRDASGGRGETRDLGQRGWRDTFAFGKFPMPRYTRLSRRKTSVRIILSSRRLSSVRRVSMSTSAGLYCCVSSCLGVVVREGVEWI